MDSLTGGGFVDSAAVDVAAAGAAGATVCGDGR